MAERLTSQQKQAVTSRGGNLLVSAAAGSGKTKVLVDRLLGYLNDPVNPANLDDFLIITYTKAAAAELRGKIAAKLTQAIAENPENKHLQRQMQRLFLTKISTVHGFCGDILRENAYRLDLAGDFRVADENECREIREKVLSDLLDRCYGEAAEDTDFRAFVDTQGLGRDDRLAAEIILKVYDSARCHLDPDGWLQGCLTESNVEDVADCSQTRWGKYLIEQFFSWLDAQIAAVEQCAILASRSDNMEKPAANLQELLAQLRCLRQSATWDQLVQRKNIDFGRLTFPRKGIDEVLADRIKACRNGCKKGLEKQLRVFAESSKEILRDLSDSAAAARGVVKLVNRFGQAYDRAKAGRRVLDFGDLEHKTLDLLLGERRNGPTAVAKQIGKRFREIMVDEYQDSNGVQDAIFTVLTAGRNNCFMVGDVKQSIYQFRLADPGIFLEKYYSYLPLEEDGNEKNRKVMLSHNFRSGQEVISAVNDVFTACMTPAVGGLAYGEDEMLREGVPHRPLQDAVEFCAVSVREDTYAEEAAFVAERIRKMLHDGTMVRDGEDLRPVKPEDIVILLRSPGSVGMEYQKALERYGIRCTTGGGTDLLKTGEIGTIRSLLQTISNPRQDIALVGTLASPLFSFSADELAAIRSGHKRGDFYDALRESSDEKSVAFLRALARFRRAARMGTLAELLELIFAETKIDSIYGAMEGGDVKEANIQTFYQLAADYESSNHRDLNQFLDYLDSMDEKGLIAAGDSTQSGSVSIMSIHKSKGLEFPVVFLCGLSREFNRESLRAQVLCDRDLGLGLSVADTKQRIRYPALSKRAIAVKMAAESLSEEMRVLYVAMTRARDRLVMTYAARNLQADLEDISQRLDLSGVELLAQEATCPGQWVLLTAMQRSEAGELFRIGGQPDLRISGGIPWKIRVVEAPETEATGAVETRETALPVSGEEVSRRLAFRYGHEAATWSPSKQTATQLKGRRKDQEAAEETKPHSVMPRHWRRPTFDTRETGGTAYGNAMHRALQYLRYEQCFDAETVRQEIIRMVQQGYLKPEQGEMVDCGKISRFFGTELGRKLCSGRPCLREFKFSILDDGKRYHPDLAGEQVLLQGVVDCALLEEDGITVIDFKTDRVTPDTISAVAAGYENQLRTYVHALERIYQKPVKRACLYFFHMEQFAEVI